MEIFKAGKFCVLSLLKILLQIFLSVSIKSTVHWKFSRQINFAYCLFFFAKIQAKKDLKGDLKVFILTYIHTIEFFEKFKTVFLIETVRNLSALKISNVQYV